MAENPEDLVYVQCAKCLRFIFDFEIRDEWPKINKSNRSTWVCKPCKGKVFKERFLADVKSGNLVDVSRYFTEKPRFHTDETNPEKFAQLLKSAMEDIPPNATDRVKYPPKTNEKQEKSNFFYSSPELFPPLPPPRRSSAERNDKATGINPMSLLPVLPSDTPNKGLIHKKQNFKKLSINLQIVAEKDKTSQNSSEASTSKKLAKDQEIYLKQLLFGEKKSSHIVNTASDDSEGGSMEDYLEKNKENTKTPEKTNLQWPNEQKRQSPHSSTATSPFVLHYKPGKKTPETKTFKTAMEQINVGQTETSYFEKNKENKKTPEKTNLQWPNEQKKQSPHSSSATSPFILYYKPGKKTPEKKTFKTAMKENNAGQTESSPSKSMTSSDWEIINKEETEHF